MTENTDAVLEIKETTLQTGYIDQKTGQFVPTDEADTERTVAFVQDGDEVVQD